MLLCDFCDMVNCDSLPWDDEAVIKYAQDHGISVSDAVALIKFCCGMR